MTNVVRMGRMNHVRATGAGLAQVTSWVVRAILLGIASMTTWEEMLQQERAEKLLEEALEATRVDCPMTAGDVVLECGHDLHFHTAPPHKKEVLWCNRCKAERAIAQVGSGKSFRVKCDTCNFTRGKDGRLSADRSAVAHRSKRAHHVVRIIDHSGTTVHVFQDDVTVTTLSNMAPF